MSSSRPCRFFNGKPSSCKNGTKCTFSHNASSRLQARGTPAPSQSPDTPQQQRPVVTKAPPGVCNFYWSTGSCRREFDCKYNHTPNPSLLSSNPEPSGSESSGAVNRSRQMASGPAVDSLSSSPMSANEVHSHLKRFLREDFRFKKTFDIYGFVNVLGSIDPSGVRWAPEDGPLLLASVATGGLLRIDDVFQWPSVSSQKSDASILSFQKGYIPLLKFYSSDFVLKSTLSTRVNGLYMRILDNFENWSSNLNRCMQEIMDARSFRAPDAGSKSDSSLGNQVLSSLEVIFYEILTRFKDAAAMYPNLAATVRNLQSWVHTWIEGVSMTPPAFDDPFKDANSRDQLVNHLRSKVDRLVSIVDRQEGKTNRSKKPQLARPDYSQEGITAALRITYEGPGELRPLGPRHDNDFADIINIRVAPTHQELVTSLPPFLPGNFHGAPHHLPSESMERLLDIQFRLLREELTASLRTSVQLVREDLTRSPSLRNPTILSKLIKTNGGKYRGHTGDGQDGIMFNVYTNVAFKILTPDWRGMSVVLSIDTPPGRARQPQSKNRVAFWEGMSGKRLIQGGLVALVWQTGTATDVHLGIVASSAKELAESAGSRNGAERVSIRVVFFDPQVEIRILNLLKNPNFAQTGMKILIEAPVMFEAIRPFLESLRTEPESLPFARYLVHHSPDFLASIPINPPQYAFAPGFTFQLASLFPPEAEIDDLKLDVSDPTSVAAARVHLRTSRLDESQCEAVVDTLTREIAMIQGPPGTGKSFTGVEILRVLLANRVRPILMIAFTNHALDHLLVSVLDAKITDKIVRLGSRSADERISKYSLDNLETTAGRTRLHQSFRQHYRDLKTTQEEIKRLMTSFVESKVPSEKVEAHLRLQYVEHYEHLYLYPPEWVQTLADEEESANQHSEWMRAGKHGKVEMEDRSRYAFWKSGRDLDFLHASLQRQAQYEEKRNKQNRFTILNDLPLEDASESEDKSATDDEDSSDDEDIEEEPWQRNWPTTDTDKVDLPVEATRIQVKPSPDVVPPSTPSLSEPDYSDDPRAFFGTEIPSIPDFNRPLEVLLEEGTMWSFSRRERACLDAHWSAEIRDTFHETQLKDFKSLKSRYERNLKEDQESKDEIRRQLLANVDIVGCTTTGAAKLASLLKSLAPRVMLVEEAGQVLEAHILGSLVPSVEHLILIGDPLQLRPTINNYALSMDNKRGKQIFKFDMSLMERLAENRLPMSQINVQRRMRPAISTLIRSALYPALQDHELIKSYPDVRGFLKNVFFFNHSHRENDGEEESASKYNTFEVQMIKDLVLYLLRQGCYSEEGDIVVLCAYLGQLSRVRDALGSLPEIGIVIDGRDKENLAEQEEELDLEQSHIERVKVTKRVRLRTIDNYQGEEARIIILSTVRNAGSIGDGPDPTRGSSRPTIGFLTSENRTNVALSRAKEGLFILGNAAQLASRSKMWRNVIEQLDDAECVGQSFPVQCAQHPDTIQLVSEPGALAQFAPDGGCLEPCAYRLNCGHVCPHKCHPDDPKHISVACPQPCRRLCARNHPCNKDCSEDCGKCRFPIRDVELPCGHKVRSIECHRLDNLEEVVCTTLVTKQFSTCEHSAQIRCSTESSDVPCTSICGGTMECCGRSCNSKCHECQALNLAANMQPGQITRTRHCEHPCQKALFCAHTCSKPCSRDHQCAIKCQKQCRQECSHSRCNEYCSTPCSPCMKPCTWVCPHKKCPLPCGSVCARLPCDQPCPNSLWCGHKCPSVCGEDCAIQVCQTCASRNQKQDIVDFVMYRKLEEVDPSEGTLSEMLITLPKCGHVFTVETLDGHCSMSDFYTQAGDGNWLELRSPETAGETKTPPVCPTCRTAITAPRYGRVFKSADLDILERNVISGMTQKLNALQTAMAGIVKGSIAEDLKQERKNLALPAKPSPITAKQRKLRAKRRQNILNALNDLPVPLTALLPNSADLHGISPAIAGAWQRIARQLTNLYSEAMKVAGMRSAHINAWEAAFSTLYEREMDLAVADPARAPRKPEEYAMRMARMKVGQPQPRGDKRFLVEAFWVTLKLRFIMGDLARTWMGQLMENVKNFSAEERMNWGSFGLFVLDSCLRDVDVAYSIAERSESRRQMTTCVLLKMNARLDRFRFNVDMMRASKQMEDGRSQLLEAIEHEIDVADTMIATTVKEHSKRLPDDRQEWLADNFSETAHTILSEWRKLEKSIRADSFYEPVSLDEKLAIVKALGFSHTGHYYTCPQGHVYVITECGGAMQSSKCPECGAAIGGQSHQLDTTNARATDFENLARETGSQPSPWAWGQV